MATGESRASPLKPNMWVALSIVCLIVFVICINTTAINTAVATIADDLSLSTSTLSALKSTAQQLDPDTKDAFVSGARQGIVGGFSDVMWLIATVGIAGTVVSFWLLRPDRQRSRP